MLWAHLLFITLDSWFEGRRMGLASVAASFWNAFERYCWFQGTCGLPKLCSGKEMEGMQRGTTSGTGKWGRPGHLFPAWLTGSSYFAAIFTGACRCDVCPPLVFLGSFWITGGNAWSPLALEHGNGMALSPAWLEIPSDILVCSHFQGEK